MSMVANGIALQKDTGVALLRELPNDETFTILLMGQSKLYLVINLLIILNIKL